MRVVIEICIKRPGGRKWVLAADIKFFFFIKAVAIGDCRGFGVFIFWPCKANPVILYRRPLFLYLYIRGTWHPGFVLLIPEPYPLDGYPNNFPLPKV